jgi:hypothetical protein
VLLFVGPLELDPLQPETLQKHDENENIISVFQLMYVCIIRDCRLRFFHSYREVFLMLMWLITNGSTKMLRTSMAE